MIIIGNIIIKHIITMNNDKEKKYQNIKIQIDDYTS
jgi:hypothetical protein